MLLDLAFLRVLFVLEALVDEILADVAERELGSLSSRQALAAQDGGSWERTSERGERVEQGRTRLIDSA